MEVRIWGILFLVIIFLVGFTKKRLDIRKCNEKLNLTNVYRNDFIDMMNRLCDSNKLDMNLYTKLVHDVDMMQEELGRDGIIAEMIDPLRNVKYRNYQVLMNFFPELRQQVGDFYILKNRIMDEAGMCDDILMRHIGNLDRLHTKICKERFNPFSCFAEGIHIIMSLPINILLWCGIITQAHSRRLLESWFSKLIQKVIVLIGLIGSIATIVLGWDDLKDIISQLLSKI